MAHTEPEPTPLATNVLWGRVATAAVVVLIAFGLGRCSAPEAAEAPADEVTQLDAQVAELQATNDQLRAQVDDLTAQITELESAPAPTQPSATETTTAEPAPAAGEPGGTWTVEPGDTLQAIAIDVYGDRARADLIAAANGIDKSTTLQVGQVLQLPIVE